MRVSLAMCLAVSLSLAGQVALADNGKPNVILCMADDLGWGDTGYNGNSVIQTPHLDRMASAGLRFDRSACRRAGEVSVPAPLDGREARCSPLRSHGSSRVQWETTFTVRARPSVSAVRIIRKRCPSALTR